jgi:diguanylate cyclase (GGDEF)-like protein
MSRAKSALAARCALKMGALLCLALASAHAAAPAATTPDALLGQAEKFYLMDQARFADVLRLLHQRESQLSPAQRWHLRYLDACQMSLQASLAKEGPILQDIIDHSGDPVLVTRASAKLIFSLAYNRHYEQAFKLANTLTADLPQVTDTNARAEALRSIIQMLGLAGEHEQSLKYVQQLAPERMPLASRCATYSYKVNAISSAVRLSSTDPELLKAIDICLADRQVVFANTLRLDRAILLLQEGHVDQTIALLKKIMPSIRKAQFKPHLTELYYVFAQAYLSQGSYPEARTWAQAVITASDPKTFTWPLQTAYETLYEVEKRTGHPAAALEYHEKYMAQDKAAMDDTKTRALAYQMVKQQVVDKKLKLDALDKQNKILELRQTLAAKAQETSRLYIGILALVLAAIALWTFRLKHSQLRFRKMARHDGLTGAFNRQHFLHEAARVLRRLQQSDAGACLVVLDLDHFKGINDTYGHAGGDQALQRVVEICRGELRSSDLFGRLGGEEFGILMPACTCEQGIEIATRIRSTLAAAKMRLDAETTVMVSASLGLAHSAVAGYVFHQLFTAADAALYRAKDGGRNRLMVHVGVDEPVLADVDTPQVITV